MVLYLKRGVMKCIFSLVVIILFFTGCTSTQTPSIVHKVNCNTSIYSLKSAECLNNDSFISQLEHYQVIFIGDNHGSKMVHNFLADTITRLSKKGYKIHLANEWFTPKDNILLARYATKDFDDATFVKKFNWKRRLNSKFESYAPIYNAIRENNGMLYGINLSKQQRREISNADLGHMDEDEFDFYNSLDVDVYAHRAMLSSFFNTCHKAKKGESNQECIERMYRVQVAWDAKMGIESVKLAKKVLKTPQDKLIVFVGALHMAYGLGANLRFARESNLPFANVIPLVWKTNAVEIGGADFIYLYKNKQNH